MAKKPATKADAKVNKAIEEQFAEADAIGAPERHPDEVAAEEARVGLAARGY